MNQLGRIGAAFLAIGCVALAEEVECGSSSVPLPYPYELSPAESGWFCEPSDAYADLAWRLSTLAVVTSSDCCLECEPYQDGCDMSGTTIPGPNATITLQDRPKSECPDDGKEHRYVLDMPAPSYYVTCSGCSGS